MAGSVPNLQLDDVVFVLHILQLEVDTNGVEEVLVEGVLSVAEQKTTLAHTTVPNDQHFEQVVAAHNASYNFLLASYSNFMSDPSRGRLGLATRVKKMSLTSLDSLPWFLKI